MDNNNLLMIILAFVFGYCLQGMMKNMCGGQIIEYSKPSKKLAAKLAASARPDCEAESDGGEIDTTCNKDDDCNNNTYKKHCHDGDLRSLTDMGSCQCTKQKDGDNKNSSIVY